MTPEPIISNPIPPAAIQIVSAQKGAYENYVTLGDGRRISLVKWVQEYLMNDVSGNVMDYWIIENIYGTVAAQTLASEAWMSSGSAALYRGLFVPSLSDLGINPNKYKVEVCPAVVAYDFFETGDFVELRLLNVPSNTEVPGAGTTTEVSGTATEELIQGEWVEVPTNAQYFVDIRKFNNNLSNPVTVRRQLLYLRLVRR